MRNITTDPQYLYLEIGGDDIDGLDKDLASLVGGTKSVTLEISRFKRLDDVVVRSFLAAKKVVESAGAEFVLSGVEEPVVLKALINAKLL